MPDYGHELLFGTVLTPVANEAGQVLELARLTEEVGLDLVSVPDHPYQPSYLDAWTLLAVIAARTSRVRVFADVANLPLRPPAALARSAASLDILSAGRVELGLGAGAYWDAIAAEGGPRRLPGEALKALREAIKVIRSLWTPGPAVRLIGEAADGWLPSATRVPPHLLAAGHQVIDEAAAAAGRSPQSVRRLYNIPDSFGGDGLLRGRPGAMVEELAELTLTHGMSGYLLFSDSADTIRRFAAEVAPAVRQLVGAERSGAQTRLG
jgi:alkanesulfonate monooxygenase SsuD/methylene tetrahydromethanopterin reductase-like flavin-dependent oxidoreductase (luciferase family)